MIELGGNITLEGFDNVEPSKLVVVKKMIGNYVKKIQEKIKFNNITIELENEFKISTKLSYNSKETTSEYQDNNLFFAIDKALNQILTKAL